MPADNISVTPGQGSSAIPIAADDISGVKYQRIKVVTGDDGINEGDVSSSHPLPVSVGSIALPTGAATAARQDTGNTSVASIDTKTPAKGATNTAGSTPVNIASDQVVPVSAASLPLPALASTAAKQPALGTAGTASADIITVQGKTGMTPLSVDGSGNTQPVSGTITANQGGIWDIRNISGTITLPSGAATAANQATNNTSVSSLDSKTPALGQALAAASVPVILPSATITSLTPPANPNPSTSTKQSDGSQKTQVVDGSGNVVGSTSNALDVNIKSGTVNIDESTLATSARQDTTNTEIGALGETAPGSDTGSSGLNGRLQRIAQRLTSLIGLLPGSLGQKNSAGSLAVVLSSDQPSVPVAATLQSSTGTDIGKLTSNQSVNHTQIAGTAVDTNSGTKSAGTQRIVLATDQPNLSSPLNVNVSQMAGVTPSSGNGATDSGTQRMTISSDSTGQVKLTDGTNTVNVIANDTGYNGQAVNQTTKTIGPLSTSGTGAQTLGANTDVRGYASVRVVWTAVGSGLAVSGQFSPNSGGTYINSTAWINRGSSTASPAPLGVANNTLYESPAVDDYFQISVSALSSGTATAYIILSTTPVSYHVTTTMGARTNNNAAPSTTNFGVLPGVANAAQQTWTEGNQVLESMDLSGNQRVKGTSESATGSTVPSQASYIGMQNGTGNLVGLSVGANFADASTLGSQLANGTYGFNGTNWDRLRTANGASNTTGTGLLGSGQMVWDGTNWQKQRSDTSGVPTVNAGGVAGTALNTYAIRTTTNTTTTPTSSTAYISSITITTEVAGTTSTVTIRDKQGTPQVLVNGLTTTAASLSPTVLNFQTPVKMTNGIDIVTAGAVAGTVDVWINYYQ